VDLVEEQDRALAPFAQPLAGSLDGLANVFDPGVDRRQLFERAIGAAGHGECERGLARAGGTPQQTPRSAGRSRPDAGAASGTDQVVLADHVVDRARPQSRRQRRPGTTLLLGRNSEQIVAHGVNTAR
jgi:hypothetical protein